MADYLPYQHPTPRAAEPDSVVCLSPERWRGLVNHVNGLGPDYSAQGPWEQIELNVPVRIGEILFLPALYRAA